MYICIHDNERYTPRLGTDNCQSFIEDMSLSDQKKGL